MTIEITNVDNDKEPIDRFKSNWSIIREPKGKVSSSRILLLLWGVGLFFVWTFVSLTKQNIADIPESVVTVVGILSGSKVVQRFGENIDKN
jgi:predicted MFS family arabinose efflux permease